MKLFENDELDQYDMTILIFATIYKLKHPEVIYQNDIYNLANTLGYNQNNLSKVLTQNIIH